MGGSKFPPIAIKLILSSTYGPRTGRPRRSYAHINDVEVGPLRGRDILERPPEDWHELPKKLIAAKVPPLAHPRPCRNVDPQIPSSAVDDKARLRAHDLVVPLQTCHSILLLVTLERIIPTHYQHV